MAHTLKRIKGQATHACFIGIPRQVAGGAAFKTLPPYGRQLFEIRRRGQVPANYTVVALDDWKLGKLFTLVVKQEASDEQAQPLASLSDRPTTMPTAATTITSVERYSRGRTAAARQPGCRLPRLYDGAATRDAPDCLG